MPPSASGWRTSEGERCFRGKGAVVVLGRQVRGCRGLSGPVRPEKKTSLRHKAQSLGLNNSPQNEILRTDLHLPPYRIQVAQKLSADNERRLEKMGNWLTEHPAVLDQVWSSDEPHFWLDGQVNSRNVVHWWFATPGKVLTSSLHSQKVTVCMTMKRESGVVEPFFFVETWSVCGSHQAFALKNCRSWPGGVHAMWHLSSVLPYSCEYRHVPFSNVEC